MAKNKNLLEDAFQIRFQINEGVDGKLRGRGEFARAGVPTANRRVYPETVWRKNLNRLGEDIRQRKVLGELDHPCLQDSDFLVLSVNGWKHFRDVKVDDQVWSRKDGVAVVSVVQEIIDQPYDGLIYRVKGRSIDSGFTPNHKFVVVNRPDRKKQQSESLIPLFEIASNIGSFGHSAIPKTAIWESPEYTEIVIPAVGNTRTHNDATKDLVLDARLFAAFMGIYCAEGFCSTQDYDYKVHICQTNEWSREFIRKEILSKFPVGLEWIEEERGFYLTDARLHAYLKPLGNQYQRYIPDEVKQLDVECLKELIFWFTIGDGRMVASRASDNTSPEGKTFKETYAEDFRQGKITNTRQDVFSVSERLIRDLHECIVKTGGAASLSTIMPGKDYEFAGHLIRAENKVPLYQLHISHSQNIWIDPRFLKIEEVQHKGNIYCLSVTHGNFYMQQNGKSFWTGNSDGKTKLQRTSHLMTNMEIDENGVVTGEIEVLEGTPNGKTLKALIDEGVTVGVSSRGYGSVKMNEDGNDVVQDDYVLMTFDVVSDPANATSWPSFSRDTNADESKKDDRKPLMEETGESVWTKYFKGEDPSKWAKEKLGAYLAHIEEQMDISPGSPEWLQAQGWAIQAREHVKKITSNLKEEEQRYSAPGIQMTIPEMLNHIRDGIKELDVDLPLDWIHMLEKKGLIVIDKGIIRKTSAKVEDDSDKGAALETLKSLDALGRILTTDEYTKAIDAAVEILQGPHYPWKTYEEFEKAASDLNGQFPKVLHFNPKIIDALWDRVESNDKKGNMTEEKPAESPKDAADIMIQNAAPSPDPYKEPETATQYFGVYSNQKNTWDIVVPKKIFTDKEEAQAFADKLNQDNADSPTEKAQFSVKPMEASEVLKTANESHVTDTTWDETHPVNFNLKDSVEEMLNSLSFWKEYSKDPKEQSRISKLMQILIKAKEQLFAESQTVEQLTTENQQLLAAAKQLGFSLFLQKSLAHHPKFEEIMSGLGNLSKFESIDQIRDLTKVHMEDADALSRQDRMFSKQSTLKIEKQIDTLKEEADRIIQEKNRMIQTMEGKIQSISSELQEAKARLFLEQKLVGNPNASSIRKAWETVKPMEELKIKTFLESMQRPIDAQKPLFESVREGLKRRLPGHKPSSMVEDSLIGTQAPVQPDAKIPVTNQDFSEYKKLAGVK